MAIIGTLQTENLGIERLDHAAYLGRELARAEQALLTGTVYIQDAAPGQESARLVFSVAAAQYAYRL